VSAFTNALQCCINLKRIENRVGGCGFEMEGPLSGWWSGPTRDHISYSHWTGCAEMVEEEEENMEGEAAGRRKTRESALQLAVKPLYQVHLLASRAGRKSQKHQLFEPA
jgi:hypothetical protein